LRELNEYSGVAHILALPNELLARLLATSPDLGPWKSTWDAMAGSSARPAAMRLLFTDKKAARIVRLNAARIGAEDTPAFRQAWVEFLHDASWKERAPTKQEADQLQYCAGRFEPAARNAFAATILRDAAILPEVADPFVSGWDEDAPGARELTQAVLEKWFQPSAPFRRSVETALYYLRSFPELAQTELLARALVVPEYTEAVIETIKLLANPAHIPLLGRAIRAEWMRDDRSNVQSWAAYALGSFQDDAAVEFLLEGLRSDDGSVREACTDSLDRIQTYRKQVKNWREGVAAAPTKADALRELVSMLADADPLVRKEAARGLSALGAVEALPDLIRRLKDADAGVREAAQQAIDRLNAAPSPAGG
jgi:HEAT repeat protein